MAPPSALTFDSAHRLVAVEFMPDLPVREFVEPEHPLARALRGLEASFPEEHVRARPWATRRRTSPAPPP